MADDSLGPNEKKNHILLISSGIIYINTLVKFSVFHYVFSLILNVNPRRIYLPKPKSPRVIYSEL